MTQFKDYTPAGVIPAAILALDEDFAINEAETRRHLSFVAATDGITAVTVNGHSSEIHACSFDEQRDILDVSMDEIGDSLPLIHGVYADGSHEAAKIAKMAEAGVHNLAQFYTSEFKYSAARFERISDEVIGPEFSRHLHMPRTAPVYADADAEED